MENDKRLIIVGTGIQLGHLTLEAQSAISSAKKLLYLVSDPVTEQYLCKLNQTAENLIGFYEEGKDRIITYQEMIEHIMKRLEENNDLCVAFYGHPGVFTYPSHKAIQRARALGYEARMLPGISTEDLLFAELGIDPGEFGLQSFEATAYLYNAYKIDPKCYVILWQIGVLGQLKYTQNLQIKPELIRIRDLLLTIYPEDQEIILYYASSHRIINSSIIYSQLKKLDEIEFNPVSTMVIRPLKQNKV